MPATPRLLRAAGFVLCACATSHQMYAQAPLAGWTFTTNITTDSGRGSPSSMAMRQQVTDRFIRMEFLQISGSRAMSGVEGMYQLFDSVDSTMTTVMPSSRSAMVMGLSIMQMLPVSSMPSMAMHTTRSDLEDLGAGEHISGHATHHVRVTTDGTMDITLMGQTCSQSMASVSDMWIAPDVDFGKASAGFSAKLEGLTGTKSPSIEQSGVQHAALPKGTALRTVSRSTRPDANGVPITVTTTVEIVELSQQPINAAAFTVPSDFRTTDTRKLMANLPPGMLDSVMTATQTARKPCAGGGTN